MDSVESQFLEARKKKRARDTLVEHHTETRVDLAEGDRARIAELEQRQAAMEDAISQIPDLCASVMDLARTSLDLTRKTGEVELATMKTVAGVEDMSHQLAQIASKRGAA